jgi:peptidylprolyl isomerase
MRTLALLITLLTSTLSLAQLPAGLYAKLNTNKGDIVLELAFEKTPLTVINFAGLIEGTKKSNKQAGLAFYDGLKFHRVIKDFMIQGGDPLGNGSGGPGYDFEDEITDLEHSGPGILSMANAGPGTNGSQFFITHVATPWLDGKHTVFGSVIEGIDVVNSIKKDDYIVKATIIRVGKKAIAFNTDEEAFQLQKQKYLNKDADLIEAKRVKLSTFVANNYPGGFEQGDGFYSQIEVTGEGRTPIKGEKVNINLTVNLDNGVSLRESGDPIEIEVGRLQIKLLNEAILSMKVGENRTVIAPYYMISKDTKIQGLSPTSDALLLIKIELISIN